MRLAKRKLFDEMVEGVRAMREHGEGKITLRTWRHEPVPLPALDSAFIRETRERLRCSRAVFARKLRINERTLEKWEQGRAKPNPQAIALLLLVRTIRTRCSGWRRSRVSEGSLGTAPKERDRRLPFKEEAAESRLSRCVSQ